eukprot:TRINITY_DN74392_c0_g1_i1.p1 TRINITY_DN74392_c0_g1~~TRINITY_DN74392_c0_g1_i1.p1  ORF type:complete len:1199 (+),score=174.98 TRINITY_DN74392_c0_g1_i1:32-3628(+)
MVLFLPPCEAGISAARTRCVERRDLASLPISVSAGCRRVPSFLLPKPPRTSGTKKPKLSASSSPLSGGKICASSAAGTAPSATLCGRRVKHSRTERSPRDKDWLSQAFWSEGGVYDSAVAADGKCEMSTALLPKTQRGSNADGRVNGNGPESCYRVSSAVGRHRTWEHDDIYGPSSGFSRPGTGTSRPFSGPRLPSGRRLRSGQFRPVSCAKRFDIESVESMLEKEECGLHNPVATANGKRKESEDMDLDDDEYTCGELGSTVDSGTPSSPHSTSTSTRRPLGCVDDNFRGGGLLSGDAPVGAPPSMPPTPFAKRVFSRRRESSVSGGVTSGIVTRSCGGTVPMAASRSMNESLTTQGTLTVMVAKVPLKLTASKSRLSVVAWPLPRAIARGLCDTSDATDLPSSTGAIVADVSCPLDGEVVLPVKSSVEGDVRDCEQPSLDRVASSTGESQGCPAAVADAGKAEPGQDSVRGESRGLVAGATDERPSVSSNGNGGIIRGSALLGTATPGEDAGPSDESTSLQRWADVFQKLQDEGEIHRDELPRALELIGVASPNQEWINRIFDSITRYSTIPGDEYRHFLELYFVEQQKEYERGFRACDADGSGSVDVTELQDLLTSLGVEPMAHVLCQVIEEVDQDGGGTLDMEEFQQVMHLIHTRECFTKEEYQMLKDLHRRFDRDSSGEIDTNELMHILGWLGYNLKPKVAHQIAKEVDCDGSGSLNLREYLILMRKVRDQEVACVRKALFEGADDNNGTVPVSDLNVVLRLFGCVRDQEALVDAAAEAGFDPEDDELDLGELWRLLTIYRAREGLSNGTAAEIKAAFQRYERGGCGELSVLDVGKMLRWLGYATPFELQQQLIHQVDVDKSGTLNEVEVRKLVRMYRERTVAVATRVFEDAEDSIRTEPASKGTISKALAHVAVRSMGFPGGVPADFCLVHEELTPIAIGPSTFEERVDLQGFLAFVTRCEKAARERFRESGGFTESEVAEMRGHFDHFDIDGSGDISNRELISVIEFLFPRMANDQIMRSQVSELLREAEHDRNGSMDFSDFLRCMRQFRDLEDRERVAKEGRIIEETGFAIHEVNDFRELFLSRDVAHKGYLTLHAVKDMVASVCPLGHKNATDLTTIFHDITVRKQARPKGSKVHRKEAHLMETKDEHPNTADFPEFLLIMKKLLDSNFAQIKERTQAVVNARSGFQSN